jgi:hypothetical protein
LLFWDAKDGTAVLRNIDSQAFSLKRLAIVEFNELILNKAAKQIQDPFLFLYKPQTLSEPSQGEFDWRKSVMAPYFDAKQAHRFTRKGRAEIVRKMCDPSRPVHCSKPEAYRLIEQFEQRGQMPEALLPDHWKAGNTRARRAARPLVKRDGRDCKGHTKEQKRAGIPLTFLQKTEMAPEVVRLYNCRQANGRKKTWRDVHREICRKFFPSNEFEIVGGRKLFRPKPDSECPSIGQLQKLYYPATNPETAAKARLGDRLFALTQRARLGDQRDLAQGPLDVVQIDFTIADIYLLDFSKHRLVGRPTIALIKDTHTRLIIGFAVTWRRESWAVATAAILNMVTDKVEFCATLGITISPDQWASGMGSEFLSDNGPMISYLADHFRNKLNLTFTHTASGRGDQKAVIESGIRDLNEFLIHRMDGSVIRCSDSREMKKRIKHAKATAIWNLPELIREVAQYCITYNNDRVLKGYSLSDDMIGHVAPIPIRLWEHGEAHRSGVAYDPPLDLVRVYCLSEGKARVEDNGIIFKGKGYTCERASEEKWFVKAGQHNWHINVLYHPSDLSIIYIENPDCPREQVEHMLEPCVRIRPVYDTLSISAYEQDWLNIERSVTNRSASQFSVQAETRFFDNLAADRLKAIAALPRGKRGSPTNESTENMNTVRLEEVARADATVHEPFMAGMKKPVKSAHIEYDDPLERLESADREHRRSVMHGDQT